MIPLLADDPVTIGPYRLGGRLGAGGMGAVYLGHAPDGRPVAVKVIRRELALDPGFRARFASEVANAQRVASFCTARVLDHGETDGTPFLVTEFIEGVSLADQVAADGALPAERLRALGIGIATALTAIHAVRLVHRDLKPGNVLLTATGPRVIDFGIARALDADNPHTATGVIIGSPGWIAPEQVFDGTVTTAVDAFAWGSLVAYAATGRHPYGTGNLMVLAARAQQRQYDLDGLPGDLRDLVTAALDPDPVKRPTAQDLLISLVGAVEPQAAATLAITRAWDNPVPVQPPAAGPVPAARPTFRARALRTLRDKIAFLVALAIFGYFIWGTIQSHLPKPVKQAVPAAFAGAWTGPARAATGRGRFTLRMSLRPRTFTSPGSIVVGDLTGTNSKGACTASLSYSDPDPRTSTRLLIHLSFIQASSGWKTLVNPCDEVDELNLTTDGTTVWLSASTVWLSTTGATGHTLKWSATLSRA
jgi:Protein kinase domain